MFVVWLRFEPEVQQHGVVVDSSRCHQQQNCCQSDFNYKCYEIFWKITLLTVSETVWSAVRKIWDLSKNSIHLHLKFSEFWKLIDIFFFLSTFFCTLQFMFFFIPLLNFFVAVHFIFKPHQYSICTLFVTFFYQIWVCFVPLFTYCKLETFSTW